MVASVQPEHLWDDRDASERIWPGRTHRAFPFGALRDAGADIVLGSDAPVSPLNPWRAIAAAEHRSGDDRAPWHPEQALTRAHALAASTDGRTLRVGEPADVIALDTDPLTCSTDDLLAMPVAATLVGGAFTHCAI
ncbi:amidohydrolase family protein [Demequina litorisediminis]|uniref:amidohydrolase family protein n=1 Tax=Demequina litorisediminis TaxID=1849022 RepID=UPI0032AFBDE7